MSAKAVTKKYHPYPGGHLGHGHRHARRRWQHIWHAAPPAPSPDPQVASAQQCLAQVIDPSVPQDGILGPQTRQALRTFQTQHQLPPTGWLDADTSNALQAACSAEQDQPAPPPMPPSPPQGGGPAAPPPQPAAGGGGGAHHEIESTGVQNEFWPERRSRNDFRREDGKGWERRRRWDGGMFEGGTGGNGLHNEYWPERRRERDFGREERWGKERGHRWQGLSFESAPGGNGETGEDEFHPFPPFSPAAVELRHDVRRDVRALEDRNKWHRDHGRWGEMR
jgi:Putative peptidoglycan binding domain